MAENNNNTADRLDTIESRLRRLEERIERREMRETLAEPWHYLVHRPHPWRQQLYIKGRNLTARQLVGSMKANRLDEAAAAADYRLPIEAIREALAYVERNRELLETEAEIERLMLKRAEASLVVLKLYLDDCSNSDLLANLLRQAGHQVVRPTEDGVGLTGEDDPVHFGFAAAHGLTLITKNPADFKALHDLDPRHSGILAVYQDNDPSRDMSNADIVRAIRNLEEAVQQSGSSIHREFHTLNDWRY